MRRCSISLIIGEMQIKTTVRYHLTSLRMTIMERIGDKRCWGGCDEKEHFYTVSDYVN